MVLWFCESRYSSNELLLIIHYCTSKLKIQSPLIALFIYFFVLPACSNLTNLRVLQSNSKIESHVKKLSQSHSISKWYLCKVLVLFHPYCFCFCCPVLCKDLYVVCLSILFCYVCCVFVLCLCCVCYLLFITSKNIKSPSSDPSSKPSSDPHEVEGSVEWFIEQSIKQSISSNPSANLVSNPSLRNLYTCVPWQCDKLNCTRILQGCPKLKDDTTNWIARPQIFHYFPSNLQ